MLASVEPWRLIAGAVAGVFLAVAGNLIASQFEGPYTRWVAKSPWNSAKAIVAFVIVWILASVSIMREGHAGISSAAWRLRSLESQMVIEQGRLDSVRIGMTEDELVEQLGRPTGRFLAPSNPYGIRHELIFVAARSFIQVLLGEAGSVEYFGATTTDYAFKLRTPIVVSQRDSGASVEYFTLNQTAVGRFDSENAKLLGYFGAGWKNFAIVGGGSHAANWRYDAIGVHLMANRTSDGAKANYQQNLGNEEALRSAVSDTRFPDTPPLPIDWAMENERREAECVSELSRSPRRDSPSDLIGWISTACENHHELYLGQRKTLVRSTLAWSEYRSSGTANTFAVTSPKLFDKYPAEVFFSIWDLGPTEQSLP